MSFWGLKIKGKSVPYSYIEPILSIYCENIIARDSFYIIPENPDYIMRKSPSKGMEWIKHKRDCDDMNRILRGWLSKKGLGNVLAIDTKIVSGNSNHALIGFIVDKELVLYDARTGKRWTDKNTILRFIL